MAILILDFCFILRYYCYWPCYRSPAMILSCFIFCFVFCSVIFIIIANSTGIYSVSSFTDSIRAFILSLYHIFNLFFYYILSILLSILALYYSSSSIGTIVDINELSMGSSIMNEGSWYLDSIAILLPILLLYLIIVMSFILLYSMELHALAATKMEVIGSQWCWYYRYRSSNWCWYHELPPSSHYFGFSRDYRSDRAIGSVDDDTLDAGGFIMNINELNNICNNIIGSSSLISFYLFHHRIQLSQSLISTNNFIALSSPSSIIDSIIYLNLCQSLLFLLSSFDIVHSFGINSLFVRLDAVPGRLNSLFFYFSNINGLNKGYCYELCGIGHFSMQIIAVIIQWRWISIGS